MKAPFLQFLTQEMLDTKYNQCTVANKTVDIVYICLLGN